MLNRACTANTNLEVARFALASSCAVLDCVYVRIRLNVFAVFAHPEHWTA